MIGTAYDAAAAEYDRRLEGDAWMRRVLWDRYTRLFRPGQVVLDIGCGTGTDALFLARRGIRVVGIDVSPAMLGEARAKLKRDTVQALVDLRLADVRELGSLAPLRVDGIIAAFGSLSTHADLSRFSAEAARVLRPRGTMLLHQLNRWSLWEWLGLVRCGRFRAARHLADHAERNFTIGDHSVRHYVHAAREAYARFFSARFRLRRRYGLGILRPPHTIQRIPMAVVIALDRLERPVRTWRPFLDWGRFFVLELEKR